MPLQYTRPTYREGVFLVLLQTVPRFAVKTAGSNSRDEGSRVESFLDESPRVLRRHYSPRPFPNRGRIKWGFPISYPGNVPFLSFPKLGNAFFFRRPLLFRKIGEIARLFCCKSAYVCAEYAGLGYLSGRRAISIPDRSAYCRVLVHAQV